MRWLVILVLVLIIASLFSALYFVYKDRGSGSKRAVRALTLRVGLSVTLFIALVVALKMGWITSGKL
jgi:Protein of unknown function (DUF2909)